MSALPPLLHPAPQTSPPARALEVGHQLHFVHVLAPSRRSNLSSKRPRLSTVEGIVNSCNLTRFRQSLSPTQLPDFIQWPVKQFCAMRVERVCAPPTAQFLRTYFSF